MKRTLLALGVGVLICLFSSGAPQAQSPDEVSGLDWCPAGKDCLSWSAVATATSYNVYRGDGDGLPDLVDGAQDSCTFGSYTDTTTGATVDGLPPGGAAHWFLVTAVNLSGEGSAGSMSSGPRVVNSSGPCAAGGGSLVINEVDYDQLGTDSDEFVEIYNGGGSAVDLADLVLVLVNGTTNAEYRRTSLGDAGASLAAGAYLVVGSSGVVATLPGGTMSVTFAASTNNIQNGGPDGVALFDTAASSLLDALSYEGSITAAQFDGVPGTFNLVEGTAATAVDSNSVPGSLARTPNGADSNDADTDWSFAGTPTPGAANPVP